MRWSRRRSPRARSWSAVFAGLIRYSLCWPRILDTGSKARLSSGDRASSCEALDCGVIAAFDRRDALVANGAYVMFTSLSPSFLTGVVSTGRPEVYKGPKHEQRFASCLNTAIVSEMATVPTFKLNTGAEIPAIGWFSFETSPGYAHAERFARSRRLGRFHGRGACRRKALVAERD